MTHQFTKRAWALAALACCTAVAVAQDAPRSADEILKELNDVKKPALDQSKRNDQTYVQNYIREMQAAMEKRGTLIAELYKAAPDNAELPKLMPERWMNTSPFSPQADKVMEEIDDILAHSASEGLKTEAAFSKARMLLIKTQRPGPDAADPAPAIAAFRKLAPKDERGGQLLYTAMMYSRDDAKKAEIEEILLNELPDSRYAGMVKASRRQREAIGKPFELEFQDAINGSTVSMKDLKGKVVVVDFWATWCGPCVGEMPNMKKLYSEYKEKGVEFIGVSLDQAKEDGGLDALKAFVAKNEITWPQYYQGNYWDSEFSKSWGINSIPCVFVVDSEGNLHSTEARGKLETMIPELLKKKASPAGAGG